jgi:outer membrane protein assembly factor BamB
MLGSRLLVIVLAACRGATPDAAPPQPGSAAPPVAAPKSGTKCTQVPFAESSPIAEASGATWLTIDGKLALVVVADSGNDGAYAILDPDTGETREQGKLPLGGGGDDLEGLTIHRGKLTGISSAGWIRVWERTGGGFALVDGPYPLGPIDLPDKKIKPKKVDQAVGMVCEERKVNCGRNYEGICIAPKPAGPCLGFVASKADGHLYCLVERDGKLAVDAEVSIKITRPQALADCAISDDGTLLVGSNIFELGRVYRVDGWTNPARATLEHFEGVGIGNSEVIAIRGDVVYRMSDSNGAPSLLAKFRCTR